jgi:hypothetical protein
MIVQDPSAPARAAAAPAPRPDRLDDAVDRFQRTGEVDAAAFAAAGPAQTAQALNGLPPAQRGALEGALLGKGLGGLLDGVSGVVDDTVGVVEDTADTVADPVVETRSERVNGDFQAAVHDEWWSQMRGQAWMDVTLAVHNKLDRPAAALANLTRTDTSAATPEQGQG